jgi:hypothetical protein
VTPRLRRTAALCLVALAWLGGDPLARADGALTVDSVIVVGRAEPAGPWTDAATEARIGDVAELAVVLAAHEGRRSRKVWVVGEDIAPLLLDGDEVPAARRRSWDEVGTTAVRWSHVEPQAWRPSDEPAPNGSTMPFYANAVCGGPHHGDWLGYDRISYFETPLGDWSSEPSARRRLATVHPQRPEDDVYGGLGTIRYKAEVRFGDDGAPVLASPGMDAADSRGILPAVHRVSIRRDDSFLGYLTSYFLVPEVYASAGSGASHQTERYVGADCSDVLVGALHAQGHRAPDFAGVLGLEDWADVVAGPVDLDENGMPVVVEIREARVGDLIRIDYDNPIADQAPRVWNHVGAFYEDRSDPEGPAAGGPDGKLDGFDLVIHIGHPRLVVEPLSRHAPARIDVLRWDPDRID